MANPSQLQNRVKSLFLSRSTAADSSSGQLESAAPGTPPVQRRFSAFDPDDQARQAELLFRTVEAFAADDDPDAGVDLAMEVLEDAAENGDLMMAQHVLGIFAVHAAKIRPETTSLPVPPLVFAAPATESVTVQPMDDTGPLETLSGEDLLHWFREDIHLNEHHRHWHMVYATSGVPSGPPTAPRFPVRMKSRQGEIFVYMHKQMLARYETERIIAGLPVTVPFTDFNESLGAGYEPDAREPKSLGYAARAGDITLSAGDQLNLNERRENFLNFLQTGNIGGINIPINAQTMGTALESNRAMLSRQFNNMAEYNHGADIVSNLHLHNVGHGVIASSGEAGAGVMTNPHTSLQDPVFWRWHKMIDDLAERYYASLPPYDFTTSEITFATETDAEHGIVLFSESATADISFALEDRAELKNQLTTAAIAEFENDGTGTSELKTGFKAEQFIYIGGFHGNNVPDRAFSRDSLFCERFAIAIKVNSETAIDATARIFICADAFLDLETDPPDALRLAIREKEHRHWIEIDRQPVALNAGENVLTFLADESSIVRKTRGKAVWPTSAITETEFDDLHNDTRGDRDDYCDCGWPISLLLPKGTEAGTPFKIMAMVSAGAPAIGSGDCGSRSFCGTDFEGYPELDDINMGFPFDRPAPNGTVELIRISPNMTMRSFTIRHVPGLWQQLSGD